MELILNSKKINKRYIYIVLTNTGSLPTKIIKAYTGAPYNHVSISFSRDLKELYSFGRKKIKNPLIGGFVKEKLNNGVYAYFKDTTCSVYALEVDVSCYYKMKKIIRKFKRDKEKYGYSFIGLLGVVANRPIKRKYTYFCSQFVAEVLDEGGVKLFNKSAALVTPNDFYSLDNLTLIYSGKLSEYDPGMFKLSSQNTARCTATVTV